MNKTLNPYLEHTKFTRSNFRILEKSGTEMSVGSVKTGIFIQAMSGKLLELLRNQ
jgi:hypothetical protein